MGQYYEPVISIKGDSGKSTLIRVGRSDFSKSMEYGYHNNDTTLLIEILLEALGERAISMVWCGDYAEVPDGEIEYGRGSPLSLEREGKNVNVFYGESDKRLLVSLSGLLAQRASGWLKTQEASVWSANAVSDHQEPEASDERLADLDAYKTHRPAFYICRELRQYVDVAQYLNQGHNVEPGRDENGSTLSLLLFLVSTEQHSGGSYRYKFMGEEFHSKSFPWARKQVLVSNERPDEAVFENITPRCQFTE